MLLGQTGGGRGRGWYLGKHCWIVIKHNNLLDVRSEEDLETLHCAMTLHCPCDSKLASLAVNIVNSAHKPAPRVIRHPHPLPLDISLGERIHLCTWQVLCPEITKLLMRSEEKERKMV